MANLGGILLCVKKTTKCSRKENMYSGAFSSGCWCCDSTEYELRTEYLSAFMAGVCTL